MRHKKVKVIFEYSSPDTNPIVSALALIFGAVLIASLIVFCIFAM